MMPGGSLPGRPLGVRAGAIVAVWLAALALTVAIAPFIERAIFVVFWVAVLFAAWVGGFAAALLAALAAVMAVNYLLIEPRYTFDLRPTDVVTLTIFVAVSGFVSMLASSLARSQKERDQLTEQLQEQAVELEQQMEEAQAIAEELEQTNEELLHAMEDAGSARAAAEAAAGRAGRLLAVAAGLSEATTPEAVADVIFREGMAAVAADAGTLALVRTGDDGAQEFETVRTHGFRADLTERYRRYPLRAGRPLSDAVLARAPRLLASSGDWRREYPEVVAETGGTGYEAFAAVPVISGGQVLGGLTFSFREPQRFDDATRTFLATLGEQCGLALERARAFAAERRARDLSASILSSIRDGFVVFDRDFRYTWLNARAEEILHRPASELLGRAIWECFPGVEDAPLGVALRQVMERREPDSLVARAVSLGRWIDARIYPAPGSEGGITVFFQDVTERHRAEESAAFLSEASRVLGASLDFQATLRAVADAAVPTLGDWCAVDIVRDPDAGRWPPTVERLATVHRDPQKVALARALAERYPTDWSTPTALPKVLRDREPVFVPEVTDALLAATARDPEHLALLRRIEFSSLIVVPLVARGRTLGALTLCMTESRRRYDDADLALAQELARRAAAAIDNARLYGAAEAAWHAADAAREEAEAARRKAEEANAAKAQFLATMSHELRTPLNAIAGHVQLLDLGLHGPLTDAQREALGRVDRAQRHLLGLITDILNYARLESGRVEYDIQPTLVRDVLADVVPFVEPQIAAKGLALETRLPEDRGEPPVSVLADREKLAQVLLNLLSNAVKFTPAGGRVTIELAECDGEPVAELRVADTGIGIPPDRLEAVFEPFFQVAKGYAREAGGTGLGLAISRDLARAMGGELAVRSVEGQGSTFTVTLRCVPSDDRAGV